MARPLVRLPKLPKGYAYGEAPVIKFEIAAYPKPKGEAHTPKPSKPKPMDVRVVAVKRGAALKRVGR